MFYDYAITVPKDTTESSPVEQVMKLTKGVIHRVEVQFPIGCRALAHCVILHHEHQFLPTNPQGSFASDGYIIPIDEHFELKTAPYSLKAKCWNEDDTYQHVITIRVGILPKEVITPFAGLGGMFKKFFQLVGVGR